MDLAEVADELYGLPPAQFRAARDERVGQARAAGDRKLAAAIARLRRPTVSAWLVNQLARESAGDLGRLLDLGAELREAQQALAGDRLRELSSRRRGQVSALVRQARRLAAQAGQAAGAQVEREVAATLEAALADPDAAGAVRAGHLATALSHVGLGGPELALAAAPAAADRAAPATRPARAARAARTGRPDAAAKSGRERAAPAAGERDRAGRHLRAVPDDAVAARQAREAAAAERRAREAAAAERDVQDAEELASQASADLDEAEQRVASARAQREALRRELEQLEERLAAVAADEAKAARDIRAAQQQRDTASRALAAAHRRVLRAKTALARLSGQ